MSSVVVGRPSDGPRDHPTVRWFRGAATMRAAELNASAAGDGHHVPFAGCHPVLDILVAWVAIALAVGVFDGGEDRSQAPPSTPSVAVAAAAGACDACHTFGPRRPVVALALAAPSPAQRNR